MLLIGAHQQGGGEAVVAMGGGISGGLFQPDGIAVSAAAFDVVCHPPDKVPQAIFILFDEGQIYSLGIVPQTVPAGTVFGVGVDGGVVPESHWFDPLRPQAFNAVDRTGGTADVHQSFHGSVHSFYNM